MSETDRRIDQQNEIAALGYVIQDYAAQVAARDCRIVELETDLVILAGNYLTLQREKEVASC